MTKNEFMKNLEKVLKLLTEDGIIMLLHSMEN